MESASKVSSSSGKNKEKKLREKVCLLFQSLVIEVYVHILHI